MGTIQRRLTIAAVTLLVTAAAVGFWLSRPARFSLTSYPAILYTRVASWTLRHPSFSSFNPQLLGLAESANKRHLASAIRSGRLAVIPFHDEATLGMNNLSSHIFGFANTNHFEVVMIRLKTPTTIPATYEILVEANGKSRLLAFIDSIRTEKLPLPVSNSPFE
jgi:hypothetical protein